MKIRITSGLVMLVVFGAFLNTAFDRVIPHDATKPKSRFILPQPDPSASSDNSLLPQPVISSSPVNRSALDEVKQQGGRLPTTYNPNTGEHVPIFHSLQRPTEAPPIDAPKLQRPDSAKTDSAKADALNEVKGGRWVRSATSDQPFWCASCDPITYPTVSQPTPVQESQLSRIARERGATIRQAPDGKLFAALPTGQVWIATGKRGTHAFHDHNSIITEMVMGVGSAPTATPRPDWSQYALAQMPPSRSILEPIERTQPIAKPKAFELALFLDSSQRSQVLREWFQSDKDLQYIRSQCNFQIYTPDNPIYRTRFANTISTQNFPAVLLTYADGGHIHAAAENMIPSTAQALASDLYYYAALASDGRQAEYAAIGGPGLSGAVKTGGYSWDKNIQPAMRLMMAPGQRPDQCDDADGDGVCDDPSRLGFLEKAKANVEKNAVAWLSPTDMVTLFLICICGYLAVRWLRSQQAD